jgi:hypothetical protein
MMTAEKKLEALVLGIKIRMKEIENDDRFPHKKKDIATTFENAPLALIQLSLETELRTLRNILHDLKIVS